MDFTGFAALEIYRSVEAAHEDAARRATWLRKLRDLQRREREQAKRLLTRAPQGNGPLKAHTPWI